MKRPRRYLVGMTILSIFGAMGTGTLTVFSAGLLSAVALVIFGMALTSLPMIFLLQRDIAAIRRRGVSWGWSRWLYYLLAIPFPSYLMTPIYYYRSENVIKEHLRTRKTDEDE